MDKNTFFEIGRKKAEMDYSNIGGTKTIDENILIAFSVFVDSCLDEGLLDKINIERSIDGNKLYLYIDQKNAHWIIYIMEHTFDYIGLKKIELEKDFDTSNCEIIKSVGLLYSDDNLKNIWNEIKKEMV